MEHRIQGVDDGDGPTSSISARCGGMRADEQTDRGTNEHRAGLARRLARIVICSIKGRDGLHPCVKVVDEHLARRVLAGDTDGVLDRIVELRAEVELSRPRPESIFLFDYPKEERAHGAQSSTPPTERLRARGPDYGVVRQTESESSAVDAEGERPGRVAESPASHSSRPGVPRTDATPAGVIPSVFRRSSGRAPRSGGGGAPLHLSNRNTLPHSSRVTPSLAGRSSCPGHFLPARGGVAPPSSTDWS
jgi:hypothetical protein